MTLNACRGSNGFGLSHISHQEMLAFFTLEQIMPDPWQVELLRRFDNVALEHHYKMQKKEQDKQNQDKPQTQKQKQERQAIGKRPK